MYQPKGTELSKEQLTVSGVKGEGFQVPLFMKMLLMMGSEQTEGSLLSVPEAGVNFLGRDLIVRFGLELGVEEGQIKVMMAFLREEEEKKIDSLAWVKEGNRGGLKITLLQIQLKQLGKIVCRR